jgi:hypothetical protein
MKRFTNAVYEALLENAALPENVLLQGAALPANASLQGVVLVGLFRRVSRLN